MKPGFIQPMTIVDTAFLPLPRKNSGILVFVGRTRDQFIDFMDGLNLPDPKKMMEAVPANQQCGNVLAAA